MTEKTTKRAYGAYSTANAIAALWNACQDSAPQELIEWLDGGMADEASRQLLNLSDVVAGIGCLVMSDGNGDSLKSGNFQTGDSGGTLLFTIADQIATLGALVSVANDAGYLRSKAQAERVGGSS